MKHTVAYRARRHASRRRRQMNAMNRRLEEFGRLFRARLTSTVSQPEGVS